MAYRTLSTVVLAVVLSTCTSPFVQTVTALQNTVRVGGGETTVTVPKDDKNERNIPLKPSHFFQLRSEVTQLFDKFDSLERTNQGEVAKTVYITGAPGAGKTQLAGQFGREFINMNENNLKLFVGTMTVDSCLHIVEKHLQIACDLGCANCTEMSVQLGELCNETTCFINCVKKELRDRPGWLLIIDGLTIDADECVKKLSHLWPQPNE